MYNYYKHGREVEREMSEADRQRLEIKLRGITITIMLNIYREARIAGIEVQGQGLPIS